MAEEPPEILYSRWQHKYQAAMIELDCKKIAGRVTAAETAICIRLQEISQDSDHHTERHAIKDALASLHVLKNNPDCPTGDKKS
jgi:hypothetical protein